MTHCRVPPEPSVRVRAQNERSLFHSISRCVLVEERQRPHTTYTQARVHCRRRTTFVDAVRAARRRREELTEHATRIAIRVGIVAIREKKARGEYTSYAVPYGDVDYDADEKSGQARVEFARWRVNGLHKKNVSIGVRLGAQPWGGEAVRVRRCALAL
ncbi:hypothetical protein EVAR_24_1 [Eumeta japonica]|uniref:Uncharacterized protein n=1 Tax=Eumeta variegata TaxID=151549 RepID=A0A4C1S8S5_EUMVA|nr:hypothetical protein EVAR_24_1 [Eumeta japonica]